MLFDYDRRLVVASWRDEWLLQIWEAVSAAAQQARVDLERELPNAGLWSVYANQNAFAFPRIDQSMRRSLRPLIERIRVLAAPSLQVIDPALNDVSVALWETDLERLLPDETAEIAQTPAVDDPFSPAGVAVAKTVIGSAVTIGARLALGPPAAIAMGVHTLADVASPAFRHWLLDAGVRRLSEVWIGGEPAVQTVTAKLSAVIDETFFKAREVL